MERWLACNAVIEMFILILKTLAVHDYAKLFVFTNLGSQLL